MDRYGLARSTGAKGCSPDVAAAEGFFGRMKTESVHPGHWEERTRDEVLVPVDDCIRWHDHERIKRSLGWMSPVNTVKAKEWLRDHLQENVRSPKSRQERYSSVLMTAQNSIIHFNYKPENSSSTGHQCVSSWQQFAQYQAKQHAQWNDYAW